LILYAYARGVRSSRSTERACMEDVAYRVLAAQANPDHATLARFNERHQDALAGVFGAVLGLCAKAGSAAINVVAVDGSKVSVNASREATVDYERSAREIIDSGLETDAEENDRFGDRRGDELSPALATSAGRRQWFRKVRRWLDDQRTEDAQPIPARSTGIAGRRPRNGTSLEGRYGAGHAQGRQARAVQAQERAEGHLHAQDRGHT
jgi:hypothetical protein